MTSKKIAFIAASSEPAGRAYSKLSKKYEHVDPEEADVIVALGGDGHMLETLHMWLDCETPIYGMNRGTVGFLMNEYQETALINRIEKAKSVQLRPLEMVVIDVDGKKSSSVAINDISLLRQKRQAAKLRISIDQKIRLPELICDGVLV
ncbi:MAG: NAD(+)/NADH kinase, partial [Pseudomonadota bacterium]|nr:NAD(+)/NADH kinase [Pseudomonadota bacterium]